MNEEPKSNFAEPTIAATNSIPYGFSFGPASPNADPKKPWITQVVPLLISIPIQLTRSDPDHLCKSVAESLRALCRPQVVAAIAEHLDHHLFRASTEPTAHKPAEPTAGVSPRSVVNPALAEIHDYEEARLAGFEGTLTDYRRAAAQRAPKPAQTPVVSTSQPNTPAPEVEITPAGTKLTQLNFESQLADSTKLENLDPLAEEPTK